MKYPEAVYRIGNEFEHKGDICRYLWFGQPKQSVVEFPKIKYLTAVPTKDLKIHSITAETLAVLALEKRENIGIDFRIRRGRSIPEVMILLQIEQTPVYLPKTNEPLGEFLLRVAIERNYLTKEK